MIRTVTGEISRDQLGIALIHEHIQCVSNDMLRTFGKKWLDPEILLPYAVRILKAIRERFGVTAYVDGTPCDLGRDVRLLQRVSEESGMPIIASTGLYYFPSCLTNSRSAEELAEIFLEECRVGMEGTGILPGILKCAIEEAEMSADCARRIGALGITQHATGLPLYAHCRFAGNSADSLLDTLLKYGADPHRVVLGHASSRPDADYLEHILQRGCFISIDQCFSDRLNICAETVGELCRRGYSKQLLFSLDRPIYNDFATNATTGLHAPEEEHISRYGFLFTDMYPAFRKAGCTEEDIHQMMIENPANLLDL